MKQAPFAGTAAGPPLAHASRQLVCQRPAVVFTGATVAHFAAVIAEDIPRWQMLARQQSITAEQA